jgi:cobyrinic acid a,c-diamide synthase
VSAATSQPLQDGWVQLVSDSIDLQLLRQLAATSAVPQPQAALPPAARTFRVSLGVAYDEAFYRYFQQ